ncbi:MAG: cupin domain-containing protein [Terriglobales bacterium]
MKKATVYFRIGDAARLLGVSASSLRNWERVGLLIPARSRTRYRLYSREALGKLRKIQYLRNVKGVNPAGIAAILQNERETDRSSPSSTQRTKRSDIARRLAKLRHKLDLTLAGVASQTGLSVSFLSSLERGSSTASIATLQKLARLYRTNVLSFFGNEDNSGRLVRARDRKVLKPNAGVEMDLLASGSKMMEPHLFRIGPGAGSGGSYSHEGEEFIFVLEGKVEVWLDEVERYVLHPGDSLYFESTQAHRWRNLSKKEASLLWVNTPATF